MGLIPSLTKYAALSVALILFGLFVKRSSEVGIGVAGQEIGKSVGAFGSGFGELGGGIKELGSGVGTGIAQLFNPLFTLRDLIFPPMAGNQPSPTASTQGQIPAETPPDTTPKELPPDTTVKPPPVTENIFRKFSPNLSINAVYAPQGFGSNVFGISGKLLPKQAIARTQITYGGIISTQAGGTRKIRGSLALFERLASNMKKSGADKRTL